MALAVASFGIWRMFQERHRAIWQQATIKNPADACKAKVSLIAHSMGNYMTQKAMAATRTRKNQPLLVTLITSIDASDDENLESSCRVDSKYHTFTRCVSDAISEIADTLQA
jgi:hypothetical protein